jgi:hypothetical protein
MSQNNLQKCRECEEGHMLLAHQVHAIEECDSTNEITEGLGFMCNKCGHFETQ